MSGLERAIERGISEDLDRATLSIVDSCLNALWGHPWFGFIAGGQLRLIEAGMKPREAWELSRKVLLEHVKSEKIEFGDPRFDWGPQGGREIIEECEIDHWEEA